MKKYLTITSLLLLSIQIISCSKYRKYEGTYQYIGFSEMKDCFVVKIKNDSLQIKQIYVAPYETKNNPAVLKTDRMSFILRNDTLFATKKLSGKDETNYRFLKDGRMIINSKQNDSLIENTYFRKKASFRIRIGNARVVF